MKYPDLRGFLSNLQQLGALKHIPAPVSPYLETTEICDRTPGAGGPALMFGKPSAQTIPVRANLFGTPRRVTLGMGADDAGQLRRIGQLSAALKEPAAPQGLRDVSGLGSPLKSLWGMAPTEACAGCCQEIVWDGDDVDLACLPIQRCRPGDLARKARSLRLPAADVSGRP